MSKYIYGLLALALVGPAAPVFAQSSVTINAPREDAVPANADRGIPTLMRRCDTAVSSASVDGRYGTPCMDATGQVRVAGSFAGSKTNDNAAPSTDLMPVVGAIASSSAQSYTNGRLVLPRVNLFGAQPVFFTDPTTGSALTAATDATYGTTTYAEGTSSGPVVGAIRNDTLEALANTNNEAAPLQVDALGLLYARMLDPCSGVAKQYLPINISTATTTEITASLSGASNYYYVCSINLGPTAGAQNIALVDDDTDNCASVTSGVAGGTTAGTGWNAAANGGLTFGNGGSSIARTNGLNRVLCLVTSAAVQVSGVITVVAAP